MTNQNVIAKERVRSSPQPKTAAVKKPRRKTKDTKLAAHNGVRPAPRSFELAKGSLATLLRELKKECSSLNAGNRTHQLGVRIQKAEVSSSELAVNELQFQRRHIFGHCHE